MPFEKADRIKKLPPYLFADIDKKKREVAARGVDIISMGIGDPDKPTPAFIIKELARAAKDPSTHRYPDYDGMIEFRTAAADFMQKRFGVTLDPKTEVITLIGSKEGIAHFPLAFINPGDLAIVTDPCYPVPATAVSFAGGEVYRTPMSHRTHWLPELKKIPEDVARRAKAIFLAYPSNPTGATATREFFEELVAWGKKYNTIVVTDCAYSEIYYDENEKPLSIFEVPGAKDVAIEFHSLSKTFNMTGWRIGWAAGNPELIAGLGQIKTNVDSGAFNAIQMAGIAGLKSDFKSVEKMRRLYKKRRNVVLKALRGMGIKYLKPKAGFFIWADVPDGYTSASFVSKMLDVGVVVTPGSGFGAAGEGYFRIALTVEVERLEEAMERMKKAL
ncbi:MAG: LL-diaminopimelate aminotransferase [Bdellovibrionota bacterium]